LNAEATSSFTGSSVDLASYDLTSSIGPVMFDTTNLSLGGDGFALADGTVLTFTEGTTFSSFQAFVDTGSGVPEPGTWIMLLSGIQPSWVSRPDASNATCNRLTGAE
jgi:hypothetical protein